MSMIKRFALLIAVTAFAATSAFAHGGDACCAKDKGAKQVANHDKSQCVTFANLNLSAAQKSKLETLQADCMKAGCTKESHAKFLSQAKGILSKEQYTALKKECGSGHMGKVS
jgi:hypothetical protein